MRQASIGFIGVTFTLLFGCSADVAAQERVNNTIVLDNKIIVKEQLPASQSGIRLNSSPVSPEAQAKEAAIENRVTGQVQPDRGLPVVKGEIDNFVDVKNIIVDSKSDDSKACIEIGTIGNADACKPKR